MGLNKRKLLVSVIGLTSVLAVAAMVAAIFVSRPPLVRFADGTSLRIMAVTVGTNHIVCLSLPARLPFSIRRTAVFRKLFGVAGNPWGYPLKEGTVVWGELVHTFHHSGWPLIVMRDGESGPESLLEDTRGQVLNTSPWNGKWMGAIAYTTSVAHARNLYFSIYEMPLPGQSNLVASVRLRNPHPGP